ncbi:secretin N-terminal domain-containing protein [Thermodesulfobacteriota bacterium]
MKSTFIPVQYPRITLFFCLLIIISAMPGVCRADFDIIPVHYRKASEVLPAVKNMLSPEGRVTFDVRTNSLVVTDTSEKIKIVKAFLAKFDTPVQQVRIRVRFNEMLSSRDRSASASGSVSGDEWKVSTGRRTKDGVEVRIDDKNKDQRRTSEHFVITTSGSPAYILTGKEIPYRQKWTYLCRRYAVCTADTVVFQSIETGMEVLPIIIGNRANIEITPRISDLASDVGQGIIRFSEASTQLSVPLGQWVDIGGTDNTSNEVIREILAGGTGQQSSNLSISLMVETF